MLARVDALKEIGSSREQLLSATIYLKDGGDFAAMNEVWDAWVPDGYAPARTCVCAPMPADELKAEITVTTAVDVTTSDAYLVGFSAGKRVSRRLSLIFFRRVKLPRLSVTRWRAHQLR